MVSMIPTYILQFCFFLLGRRLKGSPDVSENESEDRWRKLLYQSQPVPPQHCVSPGGCQAWRCRPNTECFIARFYLREKLN